jgi:nitrogen-specific signal transduction histidine kinase
VSKRKLAFGDRIRLGGASLLLFNYRDHREEEQQEAQRMEALGRLAGGIAHDFNNLLAAMMSNIGLVRELLRDVDGVDEVVGDCLRDVASASERASALTSQLLGFARRGKYEERPTDVGALVHDVLRLARRTFDKKIEVKDRVTPSLFVIGDHSQLHQALMNLCINARDAMPEGGELTVTVQEVREPAVADDRSLSQPHVLITVRDTGVGLDDEAKDRLFEPFFTTKQTGQGTGLGLAMVYGIVQNHLGKVWVESEAGKGASFFLALPLVSTPARRPGETPEETMKLRIFKQVDPAAHTILVVDDEPMVRESIRRTLEHLGYKVLFAKDGVEALAQYRTHGAQISLVLLDLIMPRMGGEQTLRELKALNSEVKVLITTGYNEDERTRAVRESGIVGFLPKPFNAQSLNVAVSEALLS